MPGGAHHPARPDRRARVIAVVQDIVLLTVWALCAVLALVAWLALGLMLALLIGRMIRCAEAEEQPTVELALLGHRTDTVLMERVSR